MTFGGKPIVCDYVVSKEDLRGVLPKCVLITNIFEPVNVAAGGPDFLSGLEAEFTAEVVTNCERFCLSCAAVARRRPPPSLRPLEALPPKARRRRRRPYDT